MFALNSRGQNVLCFVGNPPGLYGIPTIKEVPEKPLSKLWFSVNNTETISSLRSSCEEQQTEEQHSLTDTDEQWSIWDKIPHLGIWFFVPYLLHWMWFGFSFIRPFESIYILCTKLCAQHEKNNNNNKQGQQLIFIKCLSYTRSWTRYL